MSISKDLRSSLWNLGSEGFSRKEHKETDPRSWDETFVETLIFGASESASPDLQAVARQSTGSKRAWSGKGQSEPEPGPFAESIHLCSFALALHTKTGTTHTNLTLRQIHPVPLTGRPADL